MSRFVTILIICDEQQGELGFRHLKHKASPFFTYLVIACVKPADGFFAPMHRASPGTEIRLEWRTNRVQFRDIHQEVRIDLI